MPTNDMYDGLFTMGNISTSERYDLGKLMPWKEDTYDVLNSPFLLGLMNLPLWRYYKVNDGFKEIDLISSDAYSTPVYSSLIQIYNGTTEEVFPEYTVLKLFDVDDLEQLYADVVNLDFTNLT